MNNKQKNQYKYVQVMLEVILPMLRESLRYHYQRRNFNSLYHFLDDQNIKHELLHSAYPSLFKCCSSVDQGNVCKAFKKNIVVNGKQWGIIYKLQSSRCTQLKCLCSVETKQTAHEDDLDITFVSALLLNCFTLSSDERQGIASFRQIKNEKLSHAVKLEIDDNEFESLWTKTLSLIKKVNPSYVTKMEDMKNKPVDEALLQQYFTSTIKLVKPIKRIQQDIRQLKRMIGGKRKIESPEPLKDKRSNKRAKIEGIDTATMAESGDVRPQSMETKFTPQSQLLVGQSPHGRGGCFYEVPERIRLMRFLCLGVDDRVYRTNAHHNAYTRSNVPFIDRLIQLGHGIDAVNLIKDVSLQGRACKQDTTIYALAICAKSNNRDIKKAAYIALPDVCRTPTHLFQFIKYMKEIADTSSGWGRSARVGISKWYKSFNSNDPHDKNSSLKLAYLATKYNRCHGWTHRDAIRMAHVKTPKQNDFRLIMEYLLGKTINDHQGCVSEFLKAVDRAKSSSDVDEIKKLIVDFQLAQEHVPTELLNREDVWQVLYRSPMPFTSMLRNLGKMTSLGLFDSEDNMTVFETKLSNVNSGLSKYPKIHPLTLLIALQHYKLGQARNENFCWTANPRIVTALTNAFEAQTKILPSTGKSYLVAVSVGEDMRKKICGSSISASNAAAAMVLSTVQTEDVEVLIFANRIDESYTSSIARGDNLDSIQQKIDRVAASCRDQDGTLSEELCVPFKWAATRQKKFDVIIIFTSSLSSGGYMHPADMLKNYVEHFASKDYRLIVVGMCDNKYSVASPIDVNTLDVVGFDLHVPIVIRDFVSGFNGDAFTNAIHDLSDLEEMGNLTI